MMLESVIVVTILFASPFALSSTPTSIYQITIQSAGFKLNFPHLQDMGIHSSLYKSEMSISAETIKKSPTFLLGIGWQTIVRVEFRRHIDQGYDATS